jgi:4-amino-4-deoxy-L-arabinose transferase-like glycosyltransferase
MRSGYKEVIVLFFFALALRVSLFPFFRGLQLSGDEIHYWNWARVIAAGAIPKNFLHPPLWTYVLGIPAVIYDSYACARLFTAIVSSFSIPLIYLLTKHVFDRKAAIVAGFTYAIYPNVLGFSHYLWAETFLAFLILLSTYLFFVALEHSNRRLIFNFSFLIAGISPLVKEFGIIHCFSLLLALATANLSNKSHIISNAIILILAPGLIYSAVASYSARRPVVLADAFVFNSNEADRGKSVFEKSTKENLNIFIDRLLMFRKMPARFMRQVYNLWTPNSFLTFRLLHSREGYTTVSNPGFIAYFTAGSYAFVIVFGLVGMFCCMHRPFQLFSVSNIVILTSLGALFFLCSRFRIPFIHIFIIHTSFALSHPGLVIQRIDWRRASLLISVLILFVHIIVSKRVLFGYWG